MTDPRCPAPDRRRWLAGLALLPLAVATPSWAQQTGGACLASVDWASFTARHLLADGRIVDDTPGQGSTSLGQAQALFFALVHNDRATFAQVLEWTEANLAAGGLANRLPARQWGRKPDGTEGVLDANPASDADFWMAYALIEAGRLWNATAWQALGRSMLAMVGRDEVAALPGLGRVLLPGTRASARGPVWRIEPSHPPIQLLRRFQQNEPQGPWNEVADNTVRMLGAVAPKGFAPDACGWSSRERAFVDDPDKGATGGQDAIRAYLWAGMLHAQDPARAPLLRTLYGPRRLLEQDRPLPDTVDTKTGEARGTGPVGFSGALLPYLKSQGLGSLLDVQLARVRARAASTAQPDVAPLPAGERMLLLFGQGWLDGRYAFGRNGELQTHWGLLCPATQLA